MKDDNKIVQSLWIGEELPILQQACIRSFIEKGHEYHLYVYNHIRNIPLGTIVKDANEISNKDSIFTFIKPPYKGKYAPFSDLFRYHLLFHKGGWWVDTDVFCLKYFDLDQKQVVCSVYHWKENLERHSNFVLKFPKGDNFIGKLLELALYKANNLSDYVEIGPSLIDYLINSDESFLKFKVHSYLFAPISLYHTRHYIIYNKRTFYSVIKEGLRPYLKPRSALARTIHPESFAVHLWNEVWRQHEFDENGVYHPECLYEKLKYSLTLSDSSFVNEYKQSF